MPESRLDQGVGASRSARRWPASSGRRRDDPAEVLSLYADHLATTVISCDSPRFLAFIPAAPPRRRCCSTWSCRRVALGHLVARGVRRDPRREPGAALPRRPRGAPGDRRRRVRHRAARRPTSRRSWSPATSRRARRAGPGRHCARRGERPGPLVGRQHPADHRRRRRSSCRPPTTGSPARPCAPRSTPTRSGLGRRRGGRHRGHDERRHHRRPRRRRLPSRRARAVVPRRRRVRRGRRCSRRASADRFAGHRARRLVRDRPAQVAVRALRLRRAALPRPVRSPRRCTRRTRAYLDVIHAGRRVEPDRLRLPPHPAGPWAAAVVLARRQRHCRVPRRRRGGADHDPARPRELHQARSPSSS